MHQPEILIFDLDGTISDPFVGISRSINYALEALDYGTVDPEDVRPLIGPPLTEIFEHLLGELTDERAQALVDSYRERYADVGYAENTLYDDVPELISGLANKEYRLGICTSKRADYAARIVEMFGLAEYFEFVDGGDVGVHKVEQLERLVANGVAANSAVMIGDRAVDILAAKSNDLDSVGVLWGFGEYEELEEAAPEHLVRTPVELAELFA